MASINFADIKDAILTKINAECEKVYKEIEPTYEAAKAAAAVAPDDKVLRQRWLKLEGALINIGDAQRSCERAVEKLQVALV